MTKGAFLRVGVAAACVCLLIQCSHDSSGIRSSAGNPSGAPGAATGSPGDSATLEGGASSPEIVPAVFKPDEPQASLSPRPIAAEEFILTIDASGVASTSLARVHIISTNASGAGAIGTVTDYWKAPQSGAHVVERSFGKNGRNRTPVVRLPTVAGMDHLVLIADLATPTGGTDTRVMTVPLKLDYSQDSANPIANPIEVKLGENGWQKIR